ncbi:F-box only protein 27-like [Protopterus annectens]|uniref:F-box only protein 27-like n=1 Tax=Protopterus annectens TaxID=7888 RepID=UPI001CF96EE9|nr:F-box only protein 27-like [Protopterus annectens]
MSGDNVSGPFNRNLIKNPCGEDGFNYWTKIDGGNGWVIENHHSDAPEGSSDKCFVSSYGWCVKKQTVDLIEEGLSREFLDSQQPDICIYDWYSCRNDCGCTYSITVRLLAEDRKTVLAKFEKHPPEIPQWSTPIYKKVSCVFRDYGSGVRYVSFLHRGKDTQFWAGHYGSRITNSTVVVRENRLEDLEGADIITASTEEKEEYDDEQFPEDKELEEDDNFLEEELNE